MRKRLSFIRICGLSLLLAGTLACNTVTRLVSPLTATPTRPPRPPATLRPTTAPPTAPIEPTKPPPPTPVPPTAAPTEAPVSPVVIRWFIGLGTGSDPVQLKAEQAVVDDFNRSQNRIRLVTEVVPYDSAKAKLTAELAAGDGPDIIGPVGWVGANAFHGQWLDLAPLIRAADYDTGQFPKGLVAMYLTEEGQIGLPFAVYPSAFFYNKALFKEAGLKHPPAKYGQSYQMPDGTTAEWNWDTVAQVARLLTLDDNDRNATEPGFDKNRIVQYGFTWQFENHPNYYGSFWSSGSMLAAGGLRGNYQAEAPEVWVAAWKWTYDGIWGPQPFIANANTEGSAKFGYGNPFNSGKIAMSDQPVWYTCCIGDVADSVEFAAMPSYNGQVAGRIDADTFRIWKGTPHPREAFTVMQYLIGEGVQKLIVGSPAMPPPYGAMPARLSDQGSFLDRKRPQFPNAENWEVFIDGLQYPDVPSAEGWMPNFNEAWQRGYDFATLLRNTSDLDLDQKITQYVNDLSGIFNR